MALQFIIGNSGSGKSCALYQKLIRESQRHPEKSYLVLVPEQFTMQTQRELVRLHPDGGILNIDVLSFQRLAHRVFEEVGADRRSMLTETGKSLMLRRVAVQEKDRLQVLGSRMNRPGYISEVKSVLSELMQYEITEFELQEMERLAQDRPLLRAKLADLRVLYRAFLDYQKDRFLKPEELYDVFCQVAGKSVLLRGSVIALDGFAGFTPAQLNVLEELMTLCPQMYLTVTLDARESAFGPIRGHELFDPGRKLVHSVVEAAGRAAARRGGAPMLEMQPIVLGKEKLMRFREGSALYHLEQNLFRKKQEIFKGEPEGLSLHVSPTPADEVHFAARTIAGMVRDGSFRYREIAMITGDLSVYGNYIRKIFPLYDIPLFLDETRQIQLNPCMEFVRGALETAQSDFRRESVFRFLRTGMPGLSPEETDRLENYVLACGIHGKKGWEREWTYCVRGMEEEELAALNGSRTTVVKMLGGFVERMRKKNLSLREYTDALCVLLEECGVQQQLKNRETELKNAGESAQAGEYAQIYGILIALLEEMVDLLGEEQMDLKEFSGILEAGFVEARVGVIPPGIDQVQVGDIRRSRISGIRALFFLGLNDGWVPAHNEQGGIVSDMEREWLRAAGIVLAPTVRENGYLQRYYLYQNLTKPNERLYLSWCLGSGDKVVMRPSFLVASIRRMFPDLKTVKEEEAGTSIRQVTTKKNGLLYLARGFQKAREEGAEAAWQELYALYQEDLVYRERLCQLEQAAFQDGGREMLSPQTAKALYGERMKNSVTRLEQFAACAFSQFASYGLCLQERETADVRPNELGTLFHRAMEIFSGRAYAGGRNWLELSQEEERALMERCVEEAAQEYGKGALQEGARARYTVQRLKRILCRSVWALHEQLAAGSFRPSGFEVSFEEAGDLETAQVKLGDGSQIRLKGRIDRIDTAKTEDAVYVKVLDYKSGMTQFDLVSLYYGLQLQLAVYLNAALEMEQQLQKEKRVVPAGIFYYHFQDPMLEKAGQETQEEAEERLLKKLRPDGILNSDETVLQLLDRDLGADSRVIPAGKKKDGQLKATSKTVTEEQFEQLSEFVQDKLVQMGTRMLQGEISAYPAERGSFLACDLCQYADVCRFDRKLSGMKKHRLKELSENEVWEKIAESGRKGERNGRKVDE